MFVVCVLRLMLKVEMEEKKLEMCRSDAGRRRVL